MSSELAIKSLEKNLIKAYKEAQKKIDLKIKELEINGEQLVGEIKGLVQLKKEIAKEIASAGARAEFLVTGNNKKLLEYSVLETQRDISNLVGIDMNWQIINKKAVEAVFTSAQSKYDILAFRNLKNRNLIMQKINNEIASVIISGGGVKELAKGIKKITGKTTRDSLRIARTQSTRVYNSGRNIGYEQAKKLGIEMQKKWVSTYDGRTRNTHRHMQGEIVGIDDVFSNGLKFPGDPDGPAEEVINCRCTFSAIIEDGSSYNDEENPEKTKEIEEELAEIEMDWT